MAENQRILIADDESDIRKIVRLLLEKRGYNVLEAANGAGDQACKLFLIIFAF